MIGDNGGQESRGINHACMHNKKWMVVLTVYKCYLSFNQVAISFWKHFLDSIDHAVNNNTNVKDVD